MAGYDRERAIAMMMAGASPKEALGVAVAVAQTRDPDVHTRWIVQPVGRLSDVPDPACVAAQLQGNTAPTRADIERALARCTR